MRKKYNVEITSIAEKDIRDHYDYVAQDNPSAAKKLIEALRKQIVSLEQFPFRCPIIPESREIGVNYRHIIYNKYRTIFRIKGKRVIILRVIHGARLLSLEILQLKK
jgi:plasmid stabilization system protein ParE